jgi:hypothetical protein
MGRLESRIVGAFIAVLMPVCCFFAAWWLGFGVASERYVPICAFGGLLFGVALDALFLGRWIPGIVACAAGFSAYLVLRDPFAGSDIEGMFHLKSAIARPMIVALVAAGGPALVLCQYWLAMKSARIGGYRHVA